MSGSMRLISDQLKAEREAKQEQESKQSLKQELDRLKKRIADIEEKLDN